MLELNRLQTMPETYDKKLFNDLYSKTDKLRRKLASQIDCRRFGVSYEDILASFDIKFIFVFSKFHTRPQNILLGMMLNSLQNFKCRILRSAYTKKFSQNILNVEDIITLEDNLYETQHDKHIRDFSQELMDFMKEHLSMDAFTVLEIKLNPPPYIHSKLNTCKDANIQKIPDTLLLDYLGLGNSEKSHKYLNALKKEIRQATNSAKLHFSNCE